MGIFVFDVVPELERLEPRGTGTADGELLLYRYGNADRQLDLLDDRVSGVVINGAARWGHHPPLELRLRWPEGAVVAYCGLQRHLYILVGSHGVRPVGDRLANDLQLRFGNGIHPPLCVPGVVGGVGIVDVGGVVSCRADLRVSEPDLVVEREGVGAGLVTMNGEWLLKPHVHTDRHIIDALNVRTASQSAVGRRGGGADGNNIHGAVGTVVMDHLIQNDADVFARRDLSRPIYLLANDLQVGRVPDRARQAGYNGDCPEPGEKSEQGHSQ